MLDPGPPELAPRPYRPPAHEDVPARLLVVQSLPVREGRDGGDLVVPYALDCLAIVASEATNNLLAARLFAAAETCRQSMGVVRIGGLEADDDATARGDGERRRFR